MLDYSKLVRTPRTSLIRRSCALFWCMITTSILNYTVTTGISNYDARRKVSVTAGETVNRRKNRNQEHHGLALHHEFFVRNNSRYATQRSTTQENPDTGSMEFPFGRILRYRLLISIKGLQKLFVIGERNVRICGALECSRPE